MRLNFNNKKHTHIIYLRKEVLWAAISYLRAWLKILVACMRRRCRWGIFRFGLSQQTQILSFSGSVASSFHFLLAWRSFDLFLRSLFTILSFGALFLGLFLLISNLCMIHLCRCLSGLLGNLLGFLLEWLLFARFAIGFFCCLLRAHAFRGIELFLQADLRYTFLFCRCAFLAIVRCHSLLIR